MGYLILASLVWAFSFGLIKTNLTSLDPNFVTFCRMMFAIPLFIPFLKIRHIPLKKGFQLLMIGAIQYGLMYLFFIRAFQYLEAHQAVLFTTLTPLYVVIVSALFEKRFTPFYILTAFTAILGGSIIYYQYSDNQSLLTGFLLVQGADLCFAFGQIAYKKFRQLNTHLFDKDIYGLLFIGALLVATLSTTWFGGWSSWQQVTSYQFWVLAYLGTVSSGICFFWWNKGAVMVNAGTLAVFNNLKSPLGILISVLFFGEQANILRLFLGLALITLAVYLSERYARKTAQNSSWRFTLAKVSEH